EQAADSAEREEVVDVELMDGIHKWIGPAFSLRPPGGGRYLPDGSSVFGRTTPAARITLRTPAVKPSSKKTIIPNGDDPSQRSRSQPIPAPTRTPAMSSADNLNP